MVVKIEKKTIISEKVLQKLVVDYLNKNRCEIKSYKDATFTFMNGDTVEDAVFTDVMVRWQ